MRDSVLVVGCGLIGTSFALALKARWPTLQVDGWEHNPTHRDAALKREVFDNIYLTRPAQRYHYAVLAVPVDAAVALLAEVATIAEWIADVCSVKNTICKTAVETSLQARFAPMHPMAGLAAGGPTFAVADLFAGRPWILLRNWPATRIFLPLLEPTRARFEWLDSAEVHDDAMACVSHGIHVMSIVAMLATQQQSENRAAEFAKLIGSGFTDVTRLSASPADFWTATLLDNRQAVAAYLRNAAGLLDGFADALAQGDDSAVTALLNDARDAKANWPGVIVKSGSISDRI